MHISLFSFLGTFSGLTSSGLEISEKQADTRFNILDFLRLCVMPGSGNVASIECRRKWRGLIILWRPGGKGGIVLRTFCRVGGR